MITGPQSLSLRFSGDLRFSLDYRRVFRDDKIGRLHPSFFRDDAPIIRRAFFAGIRFDIGG